MVWQHVRVALLAGAVVSALALTAWAEDDKKDQKEPIKEKPKEVAPAPMPVAPVPAADGCCGPQYRTVCVEEWVPETYTGTRTVYKTECKVETYTAYKTECVPEVRTRTVCVSHMVPEVKDVVKTYCVSVPVTEAKTCMETRTKCVQVTKMVCKTEDHGHYECEEVVCGPSCMDKLKKCFHHKKDCCECECECEPVKTKTVKKWVPCMVTVQCPVTHTEKICEQVPVTKMVTTCRTETRQEVCKVTSYRCVTEQKVENYTVNVSRCVPYQATRTVNVCVPVQETFTATRCVKHIVQKQVPVETCACEATPCCDEGKKHHHKLFSH